MRMAALPSVILLRCRPLQDLLVLQCTTMTTRKKSQEVRYLFSWYPRSDDWPGIRCGGVP